MRTARLILNIAALLLLIFQLLGYLGAMDAKAPEGSFTDLIPYYIGYNLALILAFVLLLVSRYLKIKMRKKADREVIDSIGKASDGV